MVTIRATGNSRFGTQKFVVSCDQEAYIY